MDNKRKNIILIASIILLVIVISGLTYAWFTWSTTSSEETKIVTSFGSATVYYDAGNDITGVGLRPTATKEEGIVRTIKVSSDTDAGLAFNLYLDVLTLPDDLKDASFKYELYKEGTETALASGNFSAATLVECQVNSTSHIVLLTDEAITTTSNKYKLYLWIDGNMSNPNEMQNKTFNFKLHADGSNAVLGETIVQKITNLYNNASKTPLNSVEHGLTYNYATSVSLMNDRLGSSTVGINDGNIRYYGANPDNYIDIGDKYETEYKNWVEPLTIFGVPEAMIPTDTNGCMQFIECSNLVALGKFSDEGTCAVALPTLIENYGFTSTEEMCSVSPAGTPILYRVIGLFKDVELTDGTKEDLVKIVRSKVIPGLAWDRSAEDINDGYGINEWSKADLMKLLNPTYESNTDKLCSYVSVDGTYEWQCEEEEGLVNNSLYWNSASGTCYSYDKVNTGLNYEPCDFTNTGISDSAKNAIEEVVWNTGGHNNYSVYPNAMYGFERGTNVAIPGTTCNGSLCNDKITRTTKWEGRVALAYPSDYGYAVDLNTCKQTLGSYSDSACTTSNWMYPGLTIGGNGDSWLMTPYSSNAYNAWFVSSGGTVYGHYVRNANGVSPVLYLKSELGIESGNGKKETPYRISAS